MLRANFVVTAYSLDSAKDEGIGKKGRQPNATITAWCPPIHGKVIYIDTDERIGLQLRHGMKQWYSVWKTLRDVCTFVAPFIIRTPSGFWNGQCSLRSTTKSATPR